jgi:predicted nucleic acid-binding protein
MRFLKRNGYVIAIVDAGPLYATVDGDDDDHARCRAVLERRDLELVVPALVVAEVAYLIERRLGPLVEAAFLRGLSVMAIEAPESRDWQTIGDLVERYADFPLGATDASVIALANRYDTDLVITLDRRHFSAVLNLDGGSFRVLPD